MVGDEASTDIVVWDTQTGTLVKRISSNKTFRKRKKEKDGLIVLLL
jgi:hypothetical protein